MTTQQADTAAEYHRGRGKKNSIGTWFSKKFGRRASEVGSGPPAPNGTALQDHSTTSTKDPNKARDSKARKATQTGSHRPVPNDAERPSQLASGFGSNSAQGLANTLVVPEGGKGGGRLTPPPQLGGLPVQEPLGAIDLPKSMDGHSPQQPQSPTMGGMLRSQEPQSLSPTAGSDARLTEPPTPRVNTDAQLNKGSESADTALGRSTAPVSTATGSSHLVEDDRNLSDSESSSRGGRDSIGNRTMDTGKSRASTKPTTLMSLDTRESTVLPTTHIAQYRQGEESLGTSPRVAAAGHRDSAGGGSVIQFAPTNPASRSASGQIGNGLPLENPGPFVNVPSHTRPHPINNPHPSGVPPDNASVLTLASSTAGLSYGGAASSRGHYHAPSLGGARSIGGSLMGDRRNSSDTYASLKALPPLSRRGSDSSSRTRESVAASATGQNSHQAMFAPGSFGGPGAPLDRVSLHRTPSQKTVATQLSVPLSASASNAALQAHSRGEHTPGGSQAHLDLETGAGTASPSVTAEPSDEACTEADRKSLASEGALVEAPADLSAATQHEKVPPPAASNTVVPAAAELNLPEKIVETESFDVPGGPPVA